MVTEFEEGCERETGNRVSIKKLMREKNIQTYIRLQWM